MCAVSMAIDSWGSPASPNYVPFTPVSPPPATAAQMLRVIELLEQIDKKLDAQNCKVKSKDKAAFKRKLKRRAAQAR